MILVIGMKKNTIKIPDALTKLLLKVSHMLYLVRSKI